MTEAEADAYIKVIREAKVSDIRFLKIPGFEATWHLSANQKGSTLSAATTPQSKPQQSRIEELGNYVIKIKSLKDYKLKEASPTQVKKTTRFF